jgi:hypothetical protein
MKRFLFVLGLMLCVILPLHGELPVVYAFSDLVRLPGHVLPALTGAIPVPATPGVDAEPLTLTLVLKRDDQAGFEQYLREVYDASSPNYRRFLTQHEMADRFGPAREAYDGVLSYMQHNGFTLVKGSANRLTLTVRGTRAQTEQTFAVRIGDYQIGDTRFHANDRDPALPRDLAHTIAAVSGLSSLARPRPIIERTFLKNACEAEAITIVTTNTRCNFAHTFPQLGNSEGCPQDNSLYPLPTDKKQIVKTCLTEKYRNSWFNKNTAADPPPPAWQGVDGTGQTVGLVQFDTFQMSDVQDYINLIGLPSAKINDVSQIHVNGGANPGANQHEVLLDIANVLTGATGAKIVVADAPFIGAGSFQAVFNALIGSGVTIISNSWAYCEDETTLADVQSIDLVLQSAAAASISVFSGSGDNGSTCLNGSPDTAHVPATSPHITAVGATSFTPGPGGSYGSQKWWNGVNDIPPTGASGFGVSQFFTRPTYQDGLAGSAMRSVPDIVYPADPRNGVVICQASAGGCPTGLLYGGTSSSAPAMAASAALLNQAQGSNLGNFNVQIYPFANTNAFHNAVSMGSDFAHVGLGSPDLARLHQHLTAQSTGPVDASVSEVRAVTPAGFSFRDAPGAPLIVPADGVSQALVVVRLADAMGNVISGHTVSLIANGGNAQITPASGISTAENGAVVFTVTNLTYEDLTFTATDTTDGVVLHQTASITFGVPPATSAGISAAPTAVIANGIDMTTITVTLKDALDRPTPGKLITLSQGTGRSVITGPNPNVTNSDGQIQFTATSLVNETVTYTAVDVTDGDLPVPGNAVVTFTNSTNLCGSGAPTPIGQNGFVVTPFATGFVARPLSFGGINFGGCPGASTPAFLGEQVFFSDWTGDVIRLSAAGGAVSSANRLTNIGPTLAWPVVSKGGKLYAARASTGSGFSGVIVELNPTTGAVVRTLATGLKCPFSLVVDPLSGDLFFDGGCSGAGFDDARIHRIQNPDSATPTLGVYTTLPATPNGKMSFASDGTLYVVTGYFSPTPTISRVSGTNSPSPGTVTTVPGVNSFCWMNVAEVDPNGAAQSLLTLSSQGLELVDITTNPPTKTLLLRTSAAARSARMGASTRPSRTSSTSSPIRRVGVALPLPTRTHCSA